MSSPQEKDRKRASTKVSDQTTQPSDGFLAGSGASVDSASVARTRRGVRAGRGEDPGKK
jgi:hypothetical protein